MKLTEDRLVRKLQKLLPGGFRLGDDTATLDLRRGTVLTVDQQIEGVHFPKDLDVRARAHRLLEVSLSDLAASGAIPRLGLLALSAPAAFDFRGFFAALGAACRKRKVELVGGDLSGSQAFGASLFLLGERPARWGTLARHLARPGDGLWITGSLGGSAFGRWLLEHGVRSTGRKIELPEELRIPRSLERLARRLVRSHLRPRALLAEGQSLARTRRRIAAIDVSDGFLLDLARLCRESGVGARIDLDPLSRTLPEGAALLGRHLGIDPLAFALSGGEDYAIVFTLPPHEVPPLPSARRIGTILVGKGLQLQTPEGKTRRLEPAGWDHLERASHRGGALPTRPRTARTRRGPNRLPEVP